MNRKVLKQGKWIAAAFLLPAAVYVAAAAAAHLYPFGNIANLMEDLDIQYIDYFAWFQRVLKGEDSLFYSFSKSLGGPTVALFGYYLMNPLNLLCVFFPQEKLPLFIFLLTAVKLGLCGVTSRVFFRYRFPGTGELWGLLLSFSYGLMQYNMTQIFNIMWLDGVIMLPVVMLGISRGVKTGKYGLFYAATGINIALNWYTGYMICLFSVFWFFYEWMLQKREGGRGGIRTFLGDFIRFCFIEGLGVVLSAAVFYPVMIGLSGGKEVFDTKIFEIYTHDSLFSILRGFVLGTVGDKESLSIYCGLLMLLLVMFYFVSRKISAREKAVSGIFLGFMLVSCWLLPLECIWNGLRYAYSYYCRFSFLVIFLFLCIAAAGLEKVDFREDRKILMYSAGGLLALFLAFDYIETFNPKYLLASALVLLAYLALLAWKLPMRQKALLLGALLIGETACNSWLDFRQMFTIDGSRYEDYVPGALGQSEAIQERDGGEFFRIEQTSARDDNATKCTPFFNESLAYGYSGISHYSSAYEMSTAEFISGLGYSDAVDFTIYDEAILSSDALLGIKYTASKDPAEVSGYEPVEELGTYNGKKVYENPYALSLGYGTDAAVAERIEEGNPFEYQNRLYSNILGEEVQIFVPVKWDAEKNGERLVLEIPENGSAGYVYGYMRSNAENLQLYVDGEYRCNYQCWLSYLVFNLGDAREKHQVRFDGFWDEPENAEIQFYMLDMEALDSAIAVLKGRQMEVHTFEDGLVEGSYTAARDGHLLLTVPYDENWTVSVNDVTVEQESGAGALMVIPVFAGENEIRMEYHAAGIGTGILLSLLSLAVWGVYAFVTKRKTHGKVR